MGASRAEGPRCWFTPIASRRRRRSPPPGDTRRSDEGVNIQKGLQAYDPTPASIPVRPRAQLWRKESAWLFAPQAREKASRIGAVAPIGESEFLCCSLCYLAQAHIACWFYHAMQSVLCK